MTFSGDWELPLSAQPKPADYGYDLDRALAAVVAVRTRAPEDAFTAQTLGTERAGHGVLIRPDGLVLTIGYLVTEAETIWLGFADGRTRPGHALAYDQQTGFGLVQVLDRGEFPVLALGNSTRTRLGDAVVVAGAGGRSRAVAAHIVAKQEFAGYWEYLVDEAIFTAPSHPNWGGTAVIGASGELVGVGSLQVEQASEGRPVHFNMVVPIDLLKPILEDLLAHGRTSGPARPWLGLYATEVDQRVVVAGIAGAGPARRAGVETGDIVLSVAGEEISSLADMYRRIWALGSAGVDVPLLVYRHDRAVRITITSGDRATFLKTPHLH
jgi:S1-C subfamily serine protease